MGVCSAGKYLDNMVVSHGAIVCFGGLGEKPCPDLQRCMAENNVKARKHKKRSPPKQ